MAATAAAVPFVFFVRSFGPIDWWMDGWMASQPEWWLFLFTSANFNLLRRLGRCFAGNMGELRTICCFHFLISLGFHCVHSLLACVCSGQFCSWTGDNLRWEHDKCPPVRPLPKHSDSDRCIDDGPTPFGMLSIYTLEASRKGCDSLVLLLLVFAVPNIFTCWAKFVCLFSPLFPCCYRPSLYKPRCLINKHLGSHRTWLIVSTRSAHKRLACIIIKRRRRFCFK